MTTNEENTIPQCEGVKSILEQQMLISHYKMFGVLQFWHASS